MVLKPKAGPSLTLTHEHLVSAVIGHVCAEDSPVPGRFLLVIAPSVRHWGPMDIAEENREGGKTFANSNQSHSLLSQQGCSLFILTIEYLTGYNKSKWSF